MIDATTKDVAVLSIAASADLASTHHALKHCPSCYEANPFLREPALAVAVKVGSVAASSAICSSLRKRGHRGWAKAFRWAVAGVWLGLAANNMRLAR